LRAREENTPPSVSERVGYIVGSHRNSLARPTQTQRDAYAIASGEFESVLGRLRTLIDTDLRRLQEALHATGAPWTPGLLHRLEGPVRVAAAAFHRRSSRERDTAFSAPVIARPPAA
jgi:hypothetical protein